MFPDSTLRVIHSAKRDPLEGVESVCRAILSRCDNRVDNVRLEKPFDVSSFRRIVHDTMVAGRKERVSRNMLSFYASKDVSTGEVGTVRNGMIGVSALGSCVAVIAWDRRTRLGGIAHVMLPGAAPPGVSQPTKYADDGIRQLLDELRRRGAGTDALTICLVGGGNVLERDDDTICGANIASIRQVLEREGLRVGASHLGGCLRRSCLLDAAGGRVTYSAGDSNVRLLWEADMEVTS